jgi:hypothetical protein
MEETCVGKGLLTVPNSARAVNRLIARCRSSKSSAVVVEFESILAHVVMRSAPIEGGRFASSALSGGDGGVADDPGDAMACRLGLLYIPLYNASNVMYACKYAYGYLST